MADDMNDTPIKFPLKATVNKKKGKVLFVEVDGTFADVLISFLTLPLGSVGEFYRSNLFPSGSLKSLYLGLERLDSAHFLKESDKSTLLLHPRTSSNAEPYIYFSSLLKRKADFMKSVSSFLITDDLHLVPNAGLLQVASVVGVTDMDGAETMDVSFGSNEVSKLLVHSLTSMNPLSVVILGAHPESNKETQFTPNASNSISKGMNLKLIVQKYSNKLLYAEAEEDFVEFLFSLFMIPLGGVESLLSSNSNVKAIDNLYKSVEELIPDKYFNSLDAKNRVLKPMIPSNDHIFPLITRDKLLDSTSSAEGQGSYVKGPRTFEVSDDLRVTPFCIVSTLTSLRKDKVPLCDVKEVEVQIGLKEGLCILKASLTSKCALTDAVLSPILNKKRKR
ncbi:uncharacterized protein LOC125188107 [Salvia hispanica]|uniref:uncharacterized protein LOC125188107 n=1 Tax=Salvia hispanica TaxID=49212 RepID=UPI0020099561|nr:uncharacterized protein LOC125188107 [Salvia hispanica]